MRWARVALLAGLLPLWACPLLRPERTVKVLLPAPPVHWQITFPRLCWRVNARGASGETTEAIVQDWRIPVEVDCARVVNAPVLAWPFVPGAGAPAPVEPGILRPAGGIFPLCLRRWQGTDIAELTWQDGPCALVLDRVASCGKDISRFNAARLCGYLREEPDPWSVDLDLIAQQIVLGDFTAWDIDALPRRDVSVNAGPGTWFLENPLQRAVPAQAGSILLAGVPPGCHRLFSFAGTSMRLEVGTGAPLLLPVP